MLVFDPFVLLFWIFLSSFIPGALLSLAIFKKSELKTIEKVLIGFGFGMVIPQFLPVLLAIAGIKYTFTVALAGIALFYLVAIFLFIREKPVELKVPKLPEFSDYRSLARYAVPALLAILIILTFWIRLQTYSPVFQELDPYYYTYAVQQLLSLGNNPHNDQTAWYPEVEVSHRVVPELVYMEANWVNLYTGGTGSADNMLVAAVSSIYPPLAGTLAIFFLYLLFSSQYKREYALIGATIASLLPIFILKTAGGEMEIQPYAFFGLSFFFAMYAWAMREKKFGDALPFAAAAVIALFGLNLGSSSGSVAIAAMMIFIPLQAILLFLKKDDEGQLKTFLLSNAIVIVLGSYVITNIFSGLFFSATPGLGTLAPTSNTLMLMLLVIFTLVLLKLKDYLKDSEMRAYSLLGLLVAGMLIFAFTPLKQTVSNFVLGTTGVASYQNPLQRTIAEQGTTGNMFQGMLGFMASTPDEVSSAMIPSALEFLRAPFAAVISIPVAILSFAGNMAMYLIAFVLNALFGAGIDYVTKGDSLLMAILALAMVATICSGVRNARGRNTLFILFAAIIFPVAIVGILKAKYTIYMGYFLAGSIAMILGELEIGLNWVSRQALDEKKVKTAATAISAFILLSGAIFVYFQFYHDGLASSLLASSTKVRFQDNPLAVKSKLEAACNQLKLSGQDDAGICEAAKDPVAYAKKGTNYQYDVNLCAISLYDNPFSPKGWESLAAGYRCLRINDYWIESMEWIRYSTESDSRTTSWWDYGHWINYFGQKDTVLRNEHASERMIGEVAHAYIDGTTQDLAEFMNSHDSKYVLFDAELLMSGNTLGGKYGALNYLSCARDNDTNVNQPPGTSACEASHIWETIYVPEGSNSQQCVISQSTKKAGLVGYTAAIERDATGALKSKMVQTYCLGETTLSNGQKTTATYYLDRKYDNGDLKLNKAILHLDSTTQDNIAIFTAFYTTDKIWIENGEVTDGYGDRKGKFYDSNLYKAYFLENLPGFTLVFKSSNNAVKIYKIN